MHTAEHNRTLAGELRHHHQVSAHSRQGLSQRRNQHVPALLKARNLVLIDAHPRGDIGLSQIEYLPHFPQGHLLGNQLCRLRLLLGSSLGALR